MGAADILQVIDTLVRFSSATRLYELTIGDAGTTDLLVEAFTAEDALQEIGARHVIALSTDAFIDLYGLLNQPASLMISLANGTRTTFSGVITEASLLSCDGGFARYCLRIAPWMWRLEQVRNCRVWENKSVVEIVDDVFRAYQPDARWRWSSETPRFMNDAAPRSYCCQYRESDFDFVRRLLTEEGLSWRFEQDNEGHCCVLFADSTELWAVPMDPSSEQDDGIRYHGARPGESQDTVQAMHSDRSMISTLVTTLGTDYKSRNVVYAGSPSRVANGSNATALEVFDNPGAYAYADSQQARRYADLHMETLEARSLSWQGRSTVRTLRAGTRLIVTDLPMKRLGPKPAFTVVKVTSIGINNFPPKAQQALAELFGPVVDELDEIAPQAGSEMLSLMRAQALESGYANCFDAIPADRPWRPLLPDASAGRAPKPTALGSQTAIVVGPDGSAQPDGANEVHCDRLGRVRIRFHWQDDTAGCWVRVAQRAAGGSKSQFLPRIGQEVFVQFMENNIDRPVIVGALYNGQGEGGAYATPGGKTGQIKQPELFQRSTDHARVAQGNLAGSNSPAWHGASADFAGHRNNAAQWGTRSKELGGGGYNQLLFDDTDGQGRIQLKSSSAASELNLGHLIHTADNYRGSFRGLGAELRSDAYGAVRAGAGLLITSYTITHNTTTRDPAGENAAGEAMLRQASQVAERMHEAAQTHLTVGLGAHAGTVKPGASVMDDKAAPLKSLVATVSGMVDRSGKAVGAPSADSGEADSRLPHLAKPIVAIAAQGGLGAIAGQDMQFAAGDAIALVSGGDIQFATGGQLRMHAGQAIGVLGGAVKPGEGGIGVQLIAAQGDMDIQAQADTLTVQARDEVNVMSANAHIDWAAAKSISLSTAGGANITISGGNITVQCPAKLTIHAGMKDFVGPERTKYKLPVLPTSTIAPAEDRVLKSSFAFDQLTLVAKNFTKSEFVMFVAPVFGFDIPATTYIKLYDGLRGGSIAEPKLKLMTGGHYPAAFDSETRTILVHHVSADRAASNNDESWELLTALLHEFGHYIDLVLRTDLAEKNPDSTAITAADAPDDEGAKFAYAIAFFDFGTTSETTYAQYSSPKFKGPLKVNYGLARRAIQEAQGEEAQKQEGKSGTLEYFGAGLGEHHKERPNSSFGHQSIERALLLASPEYGKPDVLKSIYFGNWLRDFSQVIDPSIVRKADEPKDFPRKISRKNLTELVDVFAELEFVRFPIDKVKYRVTQKILGVYRPVEHIDNPTSNAPNSPDPQSIDPDFQPKANKEYVSIDSQPSMKMYIRSSRAFMCEKIKEAISAGPSSEGYRHFGAALHVLEDYFAHSNFVELSLKKIGFINVLPWTSPVDCKHKLPVVTGMFDSDDVIASTAGLIADTLFKVEWDFKPSKPGERTKADNIMLILLREHSDPRVLQSFKDYLLVRDKIASMPGHEQFEKAIHNTLGMVGNAYNWVYNSLLHIIGNSVDDQQVARLGDPNKNGSTDPTHSQLAKDHDNHPLHVLAASLAQEAVKTVGKAMDARWWKNDATLDPAAVAASFLVHPFDCHWQDERVKTWAASHANEIKRSESATEWEALEKAHKQEAINAVAATRQKSKVLWDYVNHYYETIFCGKNQVRKK